MNHMIIVYAYSTCSKIVKHSHSRHTNIHKVQVYTSCRVQHSISSTLHKMCVMYIICMHMSSYLSCMCTQTMIRTSQYVSHMYSKTCMIDYLCISIEAMVSYAWTQLMSTAMAFCMFSMVWSISDFETKNNNLQYKMIFILVSPDFHQCIMYSVC